MTNRERVDLDRYITKEPDEDPFEIEEQEEALTKFQKLMNIHSSTTFKAKETMKKKNHDYTNGSDDPYANFRMSKLLGIEPELALLVRCMDKFKRIETFVNKGTLQVNDEGVNDAIEDVINYMILLKGLIIERTTN